MSIRNQYIALSEKVDEITLRERVLIGIVGIVMLVAVGKYLVSEPMKNKQKAIQKVTAGIRQNITSVTEQMNNILSAHQDDSGESVFEKQKRFKAELELLDGELTGSASSMIKPDAMLQAMKELLEQQGTLKVIGFKNFPPESLIQATSVQDDDGEAKPAATLFKDIFINRMILVFEGGFFDTLSYIKSLEKLDWQFFWDDLRYEVDEFPKAKVTLKLHTLSSAKEKGA